MAGPYQLIYTFQGQPDGASPLAGLVADTQGRLYGTTLGGGAVGSVGGTVFQLTSPVGGTGPWTEVVLHSFALSEGGGLYAPVTLGADGLIYGTASEYGAYQRGTVFSILNRPNTAATILHAFRQSDGGYPMSGVVFGSGGLIYGTTPLLNSTPGGNQGTDYSVSPKGDSVEYKNAHVFGGTGDGINPVGLTPVPSNSFTGFVGITRATTANFLFSGTIYTLQTNAGGYGKETVLYTFGVAPGDVSNPTSPPIFGQHALNGAVYGCAASGGASGHGGIYELVRNGTGKYVETVLYSFGSHRGDPQVGVYNQCSIVQGDASGKLYGITDAGGTDGVGAFFRLDPPTVTGGSWTERVQYSFQTSTGSVPVGAPLLMGNAFYGAVMNGGIGFGAIYELLR